MPDNKLKQFHDSIKGNPNISGVPEDFSRFESALKNPSTSRAFFDAISNNEAIGGLPKDYNTFASSLGIVEKKSSNAPTASSGMGVLLAGKGKAQSGLEELNKEVVKGVVMANINERKELKKREEQAKITDIQFDILAPNTKVLPNFIRSGITSIASGLSYLPGALLDIATSNPVSTTGLAPGSAGSIESPKLTAKDRPKEIDNAVKYFYNLGNDFKGMSEDLMLSSKLKAGIKNPNMDTISQFSNGNFSDGIKSLALETGQTLTQTAAMIAGGAPVIGASMVGSNLGEEINQDGKIDIIDLSQSVGKSIGELYLEKFFNKDLLGTEAIIKGLGNLLTPAGQALKKEVLEKGASVVKSEIIRDLKDVGKKVLEGQKDEILEETAAVGLSFFVDAIDQDKFNVESFKQLGSDMANSALIAATSGGLTSGLAARVSMQKLSRDEKTSIDRLQSVANDETKSQRVRDIALSEINNIRTGAGITASETMGKVSKLPLEKKMEALAIKEELDSVLDDLDGANDLIRERLEPIKADLETKLEKLYTESEMTPEATIQTEVQGSDVDNNETTENTGLYEYNGETYTITNDSISDSSGRLKPTSLIEEVISNGKKIDNQSNEPQGSRVETPISDSLNSVENTTEALGKKDTQFLKKQLGIEANWDMVGEGDVLAGNDPVLAYTKRKLPDWHKESQRGNIDANSKITYDIQRQPATRSITLPSGYVIDGSPELVNKDVAYAKDENGVIIGMIELETFKDGKNGIRHIAVAPEFRGKGVSDKLIEILKENNPQLDLSKTKLRSKGFEKAFGNKVISEAYHKAKADDSNPELVNAVEKLLGGTQRTGEGVVTENDKAIADALATPENTAKALESASTFQPKRIEELTAPKIGYSATLFDKDGKVVENKIEVLDIDTETNIATIVGAKGREEKVPVARIRKTIEQVSKEFHSGDIEPELLTDIVTKDISDPVVNQQRRMSAKVSGVGQKNLISRTPNWIQNIYKKFITAGDRNTLRALEAKDSIMAEKQDRLAEVSKRISDSLRKDPSLRKAANTVLSQDYIDDKIDSFTNKKTDEAIAVLTGTDVEQLREAYEKPDLESSRLLLAQVSDNLKSQTTNGSKKEVDDLVYAEVTKDREKVRDLATRWVNVGRENNTASARKQARDDIENQLSQLTNGEEIIDTLKASRKETISAKRELLKTKPGRELLSTMNESRDMIDEFAKWVEGNLAALNIKDRDIGQSIINNSGLYMKKTYDYWTDKDFTLDEKLGKQAVDSIKRAMLPQRLSALASTKKFESASENKRAEMIQKLEEKAEQDASKIFTNYIADITAKKDYKPSTVKVNAAKVQSKNTWEREFINEEFGRILGKSEDAIDRLHASVMAQAQIQSAAEMGMILEQLSGGDFYNSRESAIDALLKTGMSEVEAGVYIGKNYKEVSDKFSPLNGKLIPTEMYDMVYEDLNMSHESWFNWLKAATVLWRMSKTVFNPSGHITNALGGNIAIAEQGHLIDSQTVNFFMDRFRLIGGSGKISDEAKAIKSKMIDTGLWGSSVSLGEINLLLKYSNDLNSGDKNRSEKALIALKKGFNEKFGGIKRYYSATDDFSKLILFHKKKDVFAKKLYGKPYESLNSKEEAIVDANIAERVKQNMPTSSRIPKFAKAIIGSVVIGDFQGFRFGAFTSFANTLGNAVGDINKGLNDKSLSKEQKKAYLLDGAKTLSASGSIFFVDKSIAATAAGLSSIALGNMAKGLFDKEEDEDGKPIGTRFDFYQNIKNSFILPNWAKGQNMIVTSDDGKGNLQLMNLSNTFPNDEAYQLLGAQENLPLINMDGDSGISSVLKKTFSLNAVLNIFNNVVRGYDNWNRPIEDGVLAKSLYVAGEFAIPSIRHLHKEAVTYAKNQVGQEPEDYNEIDTRKVEVFNYLKGMLSNSPQLIKRTFPLKTNQAIYYNLKAFYNGKETEFERLTEGEKYQRIKELEPVRKAFVEMKKYNIHQKNSVPADEVFGSAFTGLRGKVSEEEQNYILTGEKPFNE